MSSEKKERVKHSNYQICISLNKTQPSKEDIMKFKKSLDETFSEENMKDMISGDMDKIERIVVRHAIELAPEDNKLHSHSLIAITHKTKVKIDLKVIREKIKTLNDIDYIPYVHQEVSGGSEKGAIESFLEYVNK